MTDEMLTLEYGTSKIGFLVCRRERKTLEINVQPDMRVEVVAPIQATNEEILRKVRKRAPWINKQIRFFFQYHPRTPARKYLAGETHRYLGRQYRLKVISDVDQDTCKKVRMARGYIEVRSPYPNQPDTTRHLTRAWLKERAHIKFAERLGICLEQFPDSEAFRPAGMVIRNMTKRWGSMTPSNRLILNLELIRAPVDAIDYVITHELCHIKHNHHGPEFFKLLERTMPDWKRRKIKLEKTLA
jgi:predicted metal-dependent hydrolase